jgi:signal transduction histidine kinase
MPPRSSKQLCSAGFFVFLLIVCWSLPARTAEMPEVNPLEVRVLAVEVNEKPIANRSLEPSAHKQTMPLHLEAVRSIRVHFQEGSSENLSSPKLQYFLAGYDTKWQHLRAHAQLTVRFLDEGGAIIGTEDFNANGESDGWTGQVVNSRFSPRSAKLVAPARSKHVQLTIISSIPEMIGQYAVRDISLSITSREGAVHSVFSPSTEAGIAMDSPLGTPLQWARSGTRAQLAQVVALPEGKHALALVDNSSKTFGAWILKPAYCCEVREGDEIALKWSECFSLGRGGHGLAVYQNLPPGDYSLLVAGQTLEGRSFPGNSVFKFKVPMPFWEQPVFWMLVGLVSTGCVFGITKFVGKQKTRRKLAEIERRHLLEKERARIARDIHDELGASLAAIAMMSSRVRQELHATSEAASQLEEISRRATQTARQLGEIVWAVNPARDSLENLVDFVCQFAQEHMELLNIRFRTEIPDELPELAMPSSMRHEAFLAIKELIHNAVRHGGPTLVVLRIQFSPGWITLEIEDDGCGFEITSDKLFGGLANVTERMKRVGGEFSPQSTPGEGSRMQIRVPLPNSSFT